MKQTRKKRILIIEDDRHIAEGMRLNLNLQGYDVDIAPDGLSGLAGWKEKRPDLIVLDIMLPKMDGLTVLQNIRLEDERIPVLIVSVKGAPGDRVKGLSFGVDDYLTKPFHLDEFLLRVERLLTRVSWYRREGDPGEGTDREFPMIYAFGANRIDFGKGRAQSPRGDIALTEQELKLLKLFITHRGKPLSRKKLLEVGWGYSKGTTTRTVDNFLVRFRKYFEDNPHEPVYFISIRSVGYLFDHD